MLKVTFPILRKSTQWRDMGKTFFSKVLGSQFLLEIILLLEVYIKEKGNSQAKEMPHCINALATKHEDRISEVQNSRDG